uniref:Uncharacterized protein n=1 Tax=Pavo cristatus TaxID=9049 RepID=A0A8C9FTU8_PAVCR
CSTMLSGHEPVYPEYETETSQTSKLLWKFKETLFLPTGMAGFAMVVGYGLYKLKHQGSTKDVTSPDSHACGSPVYCIYKPHIKGFLRKK